MAGDHGGVSGDTGRGRASAAAGGADDDDDDDGNDVDDNGATALLAGLLAGLLARLLARLLSDSRTFLSFLRLLS